MEIIDATLFFKCNRKIVPKTPEQVAIIKIVIYICSSQFICGISAPG
jgi:hypothetical protein